MDIIKFKCLCDEIHNENEVCNITIKDASSAIKEICGKEIWSIRKECLLLLKKLVFEYVHIKHPLMPYISFLRIILDSARDNGAQEKYLPIDDLTWIKLLKIINSVRNDSFYFQSDNDHLSFLKRELQFANACSRLKNRGVEIDTTTNVIFISKDDYQRISEKIDSLCGKIGGENLLRYTFKILRENYDPSLGRFHIYRILTSSNEAINAAIPWGWILSLGIKHLNKKGSGCTLLEYKNLIDFLTDLIAIFEIQPVSVWESVFVEKSNFLEFLQECVQFDNLISFTQFQQELGLEIIKSLTDHVCSINKTSYGENIKDIVKVGMAIIKSSQPTTISFFSPDLLVQKIKLSQRKVFNIINKVFLLKENNQTLRFPPSSEDIDHTLTPIYFHKNNFMVMPTSITTLSTINAILTQISKPNGKFSNENDSTLGLELEKLLRKKFTEKGISVYHGDYISNDRSVTGDSDLIISSSDTIFIFEIKKKSLTRKAMSGMGFQLISDLAESVVRSQMQAAKIEYVLLSDKKITLTTPDSNQVIKLDNKKIEKVSVSLYDFGSLQDFITLKTILDIFFSIDIIAINKDNNHFLEHWNEYIKKTAFFLSHSKKLRVTNTPSFFNSKFMSIPQIFTMLSNCKDIDDFSKQFSAHNSMTFSTRDFYKEHAIKIKYLISK